MPLWIRSLDDARMTAGDARTVSDRGASHRCPRRPVRTCDGAPRRPRAGRCRGIRLWSFLAIRAARSEGARHVRGHRRADPLLGRRRGPGHLSSATPAARSSCRGRSKSRWSRTRRPRLPARTARATNARRARRSATSSRSTGAPSGLRTRARRARPPGGQRPEPRRRRIVANASPASARSSAPSDVGLVAGTGTDARTADTRPVIETTAPS